MPIDGKTIATNKKSFLMTSSHPGDGKWTNIELERRKEKESSDDVTVHQKKNIDFKVMRTKVMMFVYQGFLLSSISDHCDSHD